MSLFNNRLETVNRYQLTRSDARSVMMVLPGADAEEGGEDSEERKQLHHEDEGEKGTKADEAVPAERN